MGNTTEIKVIELQAGTMHKDSRYIFLLDPMWGDKREDLVVELRRILGHDMFMVEVMSANALKVYEVVDKEKK